MSIRFVIDESCWRFERMVPDDCCRALDQLLDQIELALEHRHGVCYSEQLFWLPVWHEKTFYDLLAPDSNFRLPHEINERLASIIYRLPTWEELAQSQPKTNQVDIGGSVKCAASLAWAASQNRGVPANAVAALVLSGRMSGRCEVNADNACTSLWLVANKADYQGFFRWLILEASNNPAELEQWAASAFLQLDFYANAIQGIKSMSKPYSVLLPDLVRHLSALSDHGQAIFSQSWDEVPARFGQHGVDMSTENGNTKSNSTAKKQRTRNHLGKEIVFWWHSKLERHQDRIHFYPDDAAKTGRIVVGIFCRHLDT